MNTCMAKVDKKQNWLKLKSVQTLLRIACLANRKSYMVIIYGNSCDKKINLSQVEVGLNIAQNYLFSR